ncbi:hypothetical protein ACFVBP_21695 [Nocardioides sp. NPDC057764]|uniref:hypothetical protein n=1 Tax=Nocardioides sp. NPDC057764 TaxID=3346243 RepID=UPI0036709754
MPTTHHPEPADASKTPTRQGRGLILFGAVTVALISTAAAYVAMVGFGRDVLAMGAINAYAFAGVFELSLVTVALMAREAAQQDRPAQTLLTLTWLLSAASGFFAGWHEIHLGHAATAAAFRFIVPLLAALMWHLALVGDRHLAMERSWSDLRMGARMHALLATRVEWRRARDTALRKRTRSARRKLERAQKRYWRAEAVALRSVAPGAMREQITQWVDAFAAVAEGTRQADRLPMTLPDVHEALSVPVSALERVSAEQVDVDADVDVADDVADGVEELEAAPEAEEGLEVADSPAPVAEEAAKPRLSPVPALNSPSTDAAAKSPRRRRSSSNSGPDPKDIEVACEMRDKEKPVEEIAARFGVVPRTIYRWFEKEEELMAAAIEMRDQDADVEEIAARIGVAPRTIDRWFEREEEELLAAATS